MNNQLAKKCDNQSVLFLGAYVFSLLICLCAHSINDFPQWEPLVVSVTISSALFEIANICRSESRFNSVLYELYDKKLLGIGAKCAGDELLEYELLQEKQTNKKRENSIKNWNFTSRVISFVGVVFLLCNTVLGRRLSSMSDSLDTITIIAFILVLLTRLLGNWNEEIIIESEKHIKELNDKIDASIYKNTQEAPDNAD